MKWGWNTCRTGSWWGAPRPVSSGPEAVLAAMQIPAAVLSPPMAQSPWERPAYNHRLSTIRILAPWHRWASPHPVAAPLSVGRVRPAAVPASLPESMLLKLLGSGGWAELRHAGRCRVYGPEQCPGTDRFPRPAIAAPAPWAIIPGVSRCVPGEWAPPQRRRRSPVRWNSNRWGAVCPNWE